jgi:hypothetical protein
MALQIGQKYVAGIKIYYNLMKCNFVSNCILYILYYILVQIFVKPISNS